MNENSPIRKNVKSIHPSNVIINKQKFADNVKYYANMVEENGSSLCTVLKANAYGHGIDVCCRLAVENGAKMIGIVDNWEAQCIREVGLKDIRIIRLRPAMEEEIFEAQQWNVEEIIGSKEMGQIVEKVSKRLNRKIDVHIAFDAGIGRMEFNLPQDEEDLKWVIDHIKSIRVVGMMSHFASADDDIEETKEDDESVMKHIETFKKIVEESQKAENGGEGKEIIIHCANSAATLLIPNTWRHMVRVGIHLYVPQMCPLAPPPQPKKIKDNERELKVGHVMKWTTRIAAIRTLPFGATIGYGKTFHVGRNDQYNNKNNNNNNNNNMKNGRFATLPVGYADGYLRCYQNNPSGLKMEKDDNDNDNDSRDDGLSVMIHGERCRVVGRVSMDMVMVDVTRLERKLDRKLEVGTEVLLLGEELSAYEISKRTKFSVIPYEVVLMCGNGARNLNYI